MSFKSKNSPELARIKEAAATKLRAQRTKLRALKQRRTALFSSLARCISMPMIAECLIDPLSAFELSARHLSTAKRAANRIERAAFLLSGVPGVNAAEFGRKVVERPRRRLWNRVRPSLRPELVDEEIETPLLPLETTLNIAGVEAGEGTSPVKVLDRFRARVGCDWAQAARMLAGAGVFPGTLNADTIESAASARRFWQHWQSSCRAYHAAVHLGQIEGIEGDWGLLTATEFDQLLPGTSLYQLLPRISLPQNASRHQWLAQLFRDRASSSVELDLHAANYKPVITIPF